ncbi:PRC-barrel domain-containing protein [Jiella sonneratiae]|uniref:PRC-barrel domain-containing protein n=1 Tax=Jiella sonneratiae TaxID=2816856 RepID=A0ABS3J6V5_9HYPH|nr:PRC-barrel domain-containing protein [Jiella sonneratiae]MBO0904852.1 PRC-barrel domain-containing protein [Jiella sonneratiae]
MIRKLLATTAVAALLTAPAFAQDASKSDQQMQQPAATQPSGDATSGDNAAMSGDAKQADATQAAASGNYLTKLSDDQYMASNLTGKSVYDGEGKDAKSVGDIQNFLIGSDGKIVAAIVDATVNDESKVVAIPFSKIGWTMDENKEPRAVLKADMNELASAPAFKTREEKQSEQQQAAAQNNAATAPAAGTATAPASGDQMAATQPADNAASGDQSMAANKTDDATAAGKTDRETATNEGGSTEYPATPGSDQYLSENVIGADVYTGPGKDAEDIGGIDDLVVASSGKVDAAVIGVGGFLGIGEKDVAVPFDQLKMSRDENDQPRITASLNKDALNQAPEFDDDKSSDKMAANTGDQPADSSGQMAATGAATGAAAGNAMDNAGDKTADAADNAGDATQKAAENTGQAMDNAGDKMANAADNAGDATQKAAENTGQAMDNAGDKTADMADSAAGTTGQAAQGMAATNPQADATTTASTGGSQRQGLTKVDDDASLTADDLMGTTVYGPNDESVGEIGDIALNAEGKVDAVIVDVGGFLGIGEKPVALGMDNLNFMRDKDGELYLYTQFTEDQLNNAPEFNKDTYADNRDSMRLEANGQNMGAKDGGQTGDQSGAATTQPAN